MQRQQHPLTKLELTPPERLRFGGDSVGSGDEATPDPDGASWPRVPPNASEELRAEVRGFVGLPL